MADDELNNFLASFQRISEKVVQLKEENTALRSQLQQEKEKTNQLMRDMHAQRSQNEGELFLQTFRQVGEHFLTMGRVFSRAQKVEDIKSFFQQNFQQKSENENRLVGAEKSERLSADSLGNSSEDSLKDSSGNLSGENVSKEEFSENENRLARAEKSEELKLNPYDQDDFFVAGEENSEKSKENEQMRMPAWLLDEENDDPFAVKEGVDDDDALMKNLKDVKL